MSCDIGALRRGDAELGSARSRSLIMTARAKRSVAARRRVVEDNENDQAEQETSLNTLENGVLMPGTQLCEIVNVQRASCGFCNDHNTAALVCTACRVRICYKGECLSKHARFMRPLRFATGASLASLKLVNKSVKKLPNKGHGRGGHAPGAAAPGQHGAARGTGGRGTGERAAGGRTAKRAGAERARGAHGRDGTGMPAATQQAVHPVPSCCLWFVRVQAVGS